MHPLHCHLQSSYCSIKPHNKQNHKLTNLNILSYNVVLDHIHSYAGVLVVQQVEGQTRLAQMLALRQGEGSGGRGTYTARATDFPSPPNTTVSPSPTSKEGLLGCGHRKSAQDSCLGTARYSLRRRRQRGPAGPSWKMYPGRATRYRLRHEPMPGSGAK